MKDFRLSEIKTKCTGNCFKCDERNEELSKFCRRFIKTYDDREMPRDWDIEPRDMIELPCKLKYIKINPDRQKYFIGSEAWKVIYMAKYDGQIYDESFDEEVEADEFLQELKNGKV